ncbi:MAG: hypothetical protein JKY66_07350 [Spongiibacteraceae bacterium]|nr:hypothetical protein [Spongiibacteraceae bacterium]
MADDNVENDDEGVASDVVYALKYQATFHSLLSSALLLITAILIAVFVLCLVSGIESVKVLVELKPENRVEQMAKKIELGLKAAESQYAEHLDKMNDSSIFTVSEKFKILYEASFESEQDNGQMLSDYQQITYQIASRTKGSGEWFQFYDEKLNKYIKANKKRELALSRYVHKPDSVE